MKRLWRTWREQPRSFTHLCEQLDARYGIPRPAVAQHLPAYQATVFFLSVCVEGVLLIVAGMFSAWIWWKAARWLEVSIEVELFCHVLSLTGVLISWAEVASLTLPYYHIHQRSTYGTSRWADALLLKDLHLSRRKTEALKAGELPLGGLGTEYDVVLSAAHAMCHLALFGPPGSGKSATFIMNWLKVWSQTGSAIVLDPKGELYDQTAFHFENVFRIDLHEPARSDRWNFLPACRGDAEMAHEAAATILGVDANKPTTADPFWKEAETAALTAILLHLAQAVPRPTPAMIQELVSGYSLADLNKMMMSSADKNVPLYWGMFTKVEPKLQGGVLIGLGVRCASFSIPNAKAISSPITPYFAARGIRPVSFEELRRPRTAIYVVVPEGDAMRYKIVIATLFGLAASYLRKAELQMDSAPVLFSFDEAGSIPIHGLGEMVSVGRSRLMAVALGYQNIGQVYNQYGSDGGDAILGSVGTMVFLPGLDHRTAEYASKRIGQATVWQSTSVDVKEGTKFDSERTTEVGRALMDASEVRRMVKHRQAVAIIGNAPPVRFAYPSLAKLDDPPLSRREQTFCNADSLPPPASQFQPATDSSEVVISGMTQTAARTGQLPAIVIERQEPERVVEVKSVDEEQIERAEADTERRIPLFNARQFKMIGAATGAQALGFQPEYDPEKIAPANDPCCSDGVERDEPER
ncbi:MAG: type IV secretory system conjugative DNA transfer family protein [Acidobacteriota bacterium]